MSITVKFGGSSLANADEIRKVKAILDNNPERRYLVVSAPGKRNRNDTKVTDLLYELYDASVEGKGVMNLLDQIYARFQEIISDLHITFDLNNEIRLLRLSLKQPDRSYIASRGEHIQSMILAAYLKWPFVDSRDIIRFDEKGNFLPAETYTFTAEKLNTLDHAVIPGFYGSDKKGRIHVFSRGGSDITGAICARAVRSEIYENWTDVNGLLSCDPNIVSHPKRIKEISYQELRELAYMGASVLHEDAVFPVKSAGIPINIRNTNEPDNPGTMILSSHHNFDAGHIITGIAGKKGISNIQIDKAMMNAEVGFGAEVLHILAQNHVPYEHTPTSIDTMSVLVSTKDLENCRNDILSQIQTQLHPDHVFIEDHIALIAVVGEGMAKKPGIAAAILQVLADVDVNIRMIDVSFSELNMILAVDEKNYEKAVRAVYAAMEQYM